MNHMTCLRRQRCRGITLVETAVSVLIVSMLVLASMQSLTSSFKSSQFSQNRSKGMFLAEQLLVELSLLPWRDPQNPATADTVGRDTGDPSNVTRRDQLDDVDDFDNWLESPVATRAGTSLSGVPAAWRRSVLVDNVSPTNPSSTVADNAGQGVRRLTVVVDDGLTELARLSVLVSSADAALRSASDQQRSLPNVSQ